MKIEDILYVIYMIAESFNTMISGNLTSGPISFDLG